jgi:hypothetical protein
MRGNRYKTFYCTSGWCRHHHRRSERTRPTVFNGKNENIGTIEDLIVAHSNKVPFAVLSVGHFLGMGTKFAVVPCNSLQVRDNKTTLPRTTKEFLKSLLEFKYADRGESQVWSMPRTTS